jgi:hypothetical protein
MYDCQPWPHEISDYTKLCGRRLMKVNPYTRAPSRGQTCGMPAGHKAKRCMSEPAYQDEIEYARMRSGDVYLDGSGLANWLRYHGLSV